MYVSYNYARSKVIHTRSCCWHTHTRARAHTHTHTVTHAADFSTQTTRWPIIIILIILSTTPKPMLYFKSYADQDQRYDAGDRQNPLCQRQDVVQSFDLCRIRPLSPAILCPCSTCIVRGLLVHCWVA